MLKRFVAMSSKLANQPSRWTFNVGVARSLLALSCFGTLFFSSLATMIRPGSGLEPLLCEGASSLSVWCVVPAAHYELVRIGALLVLAITASGWRPRLTAIPLWWILFSNQASLTTVDGGDQIASVLALLLLPISLTDPRTWHWQKANLETATNRPYLAILAGVSGAVLQVQVAFIYINACLSKLSVPEWLDGTAGYYWLQDPMFGPAGVLRTLSDTLMVHAVPVAAMTWGSLVTEFMLGIALFLPRRAKSVLLATGLLFHLGIAVTMGLWSFGFAMWAALFLYLWPEGNLGARVRSILHSWRARSDSERDNADEAIRSLRVE